MKRSGFTLIEIMMVLMITGTLAGVFLPRLSFFFEPPSATLQRAIEEATDTALSGVPVRLKIETEEISRRGFIVAEALMKKEEPEDSLSVFLGTNLTRPTVLEWQNVKLKNLPENEGWKFEPEIINFFTDGSCTPARITWASRNTTERDADEYILTVTGYCVMVEKD